MIRAFRFAEHTPPNIQIKLQNIKIKKITLKKSRTHVTFHALKTHARAYILHSYHIRTDKNRFNLSFSYYLKRSTNSLTVDPVEIHAARNVLCAWMNEWRYLRPPRHRDKAPARTPIFQDASSNSRVAALSMDAAIPRRAVAPWRPPEVP